MSFAAGVVVLLLAAGGADEPRWSDEPAGPALEPVAAAPALSFDALPPAPKVGEDARVKRFLGALAGGVIGLGSSLALMPLGDAVGCFGGPCVSFVHGLVGVLAPLLSVTGAWLGFELMGGDAGLLTPLAALVPAVLIALGFSTIVGLQSSTSTSLVSLVPLLVASGAFLAGFAALSLDARSRQLENLGAAASWGKAGAGRVAVTALVALLTGGAAAAVSGLLFVLGQYGPLSAVLTAVGATAGTLGAAAAVWGVHRGMSGKGTLGSALAGYGLGWLATAAGLTLFALSQSVNVFSGTGLVRSSADTILFVELVAVSAVFLPVIALEWSHTNAIEASMPKFSFSAAPMPQGGMVAAAMRF